MNDVERKVYTDLVYFLGKALGTNTEVVLQDISEQQIGIVAIVNGHISGRKVGDGPSEFIMQMMNDKECTDLHRVNFPTVAHGGRVLRSSTYFIRDDDKTLSGVLCVNTDISELLAISEQVKQLSGIEDFSEEQTEESANIYLISAEDVILDNIDAILLEMNINIPLNRLTTKEKQILVLKLQEKGVFNLKGAVAEVACLLKVSEPTIYRYLTKSDN